MTKSCLIAALAITTAAAYCQKSMAASTDRRGAAGKSSIQARNDELAKACSSGDVDRVRRLLARSKFAGGLDIDGDPYPFAALKASVNALSILKLLVANGANVHARNRDGDTLLATALHSGSVDVVRYLIGMGEDAGAYDRRGVPIWMRAIGRRHLLDALISRGIDIDQRTADGRTALDIAVSAGSLDDVDSLLRRRADPNIATPFGKTPYDFACERRDDLRARIIKRLVRAGERDAKLPGPGLPLPASEDSDEAAIARVLVKRSVSPDYPRLFLRDAYQLNETQAREYASTLQNDPTVPKELSALFGKPDSHRPNLFPVLSGLSNVEYARADQVEGAFRQDWSVFDKNFPNWDGFLTMTMPVLDQTRTIAVVYFEDDIPGTGSHGELVILNKKNGIWTISKDEGGWIS